MLVGMALIFSMFYMMADRGDITILSYSEDSKCAGTLWEPCYAYLEFKANIDIYIYPTDNTTWAFQTKPENSMKEIIMKRSWGTGYRTINLSKSWSTKVKYAIKFSKGNNYKIQYKGYKHNINDTVKWGFGFDNGNPNENTKEYIDPSWLGYDSDDFFVELKEVHVDITNGYAIFTIKNPLPVDIDLNEDTLSSMFTVARGELISWNYSIQEHTEAKNVTKTEDVCVDNLSTETVYDAGNDTYTNITINNPICTKEKVNYTIPKKIEKKPVNKKLKSNEEIELKIDLRYTPNSRIDWIPILKVSDSEFKQKKWTWFNSSWDYKKEIQIDGTGLEIPSNYQLKLRVPYSTYMNTTFQDWRGVNSSDTGALHYWVEENTSSTNATIWVKMPTISNSSNTTPYEYYGNTGATTTSNAANTLGTGIERFYVMTGGLTDSIGGYDLTNYGADLAIDRNGDTLNAYDFIDTNTDYAETKTLTGLTDDTIGTIAFWANIDSDDSAENMIFAVSNDASATRTELFVEFDMRTDNDRIYAVLKTDGTTQFACNSPDNGLDTLIGSWVHVAVVQNGTTPQIYLNGVAQTMTCSITTDETLWFKAVLTDATTKADTLALATIPIDGTNYVYFDGLIDDVRIYDENKSAAQILSMYSPNEANINYSFGVEQSAPPTITLHSPLDDSTNTSTTVTFRYTPTDNSGFINCSLWTNETSWSKKEGNTSAIVNNSINAINETFSSNGDYLWNIKCINTNSVDNFSASNWTIIIDQSGTATVTTLYLDGLSQDRFYEHGYVAELKANVTNGGSILNETVCLDIDSTSYGDDYVCSNGTIEYNWTTESTLDEFNDSSTSVITQINETFYATVNSLSKLNHFKFNISGVKNTSFYEWVRNDTLQDGISYTGVSWPSGALEYNVTGDGNWTLIMAGDDVDEFSGYYWNGSSWVSHSSIINGLGNNTDWATPESATNLTGNNLKHLITGASDGTFMGYTWNGTGWSDNVSIISGLTDVGTQSIPDIHYDIFGNNVWTLISGEGDVNFNGWQWNGTGWDVNNTIKAGLPTSGDSSYWYGAVEAVYNLDNRSSWVLFYTPYSGWRKTAYLWNGTSWYETQDYSKSGYNASHYIRGIYGVATMGRMSIDEDFPTAGYFGNIILSGKDGFHPYWTDYRSNVDIDVDNDGTADVSLPGYLKETYSEIFELNDTRTEELTLSYLSTVIRSMYLPYGKTVSVSNITLSGALGDLGDRLESELDISRVGTPRGINLDATDRIQVIGDNGIVFEFDTDGNYYSNFNSTFENAYGIADNVTHYFITDPTTNKTHLFLVNGSYVKVLFTSVNKPWGIDYHNDYLYTQEQTDYDAGMTYTFNRTKRYTNGTIHTSKEHAAITNTNTSIIMSYGTYDGTDYIWEFDKGGTNYITRCLSSTLTTCTHEFIATPEHKKISGLDNDNVTFYISNYEDKVIRKYVMNKTYPSDVSIVLGDNTLYSMTGDFNSEIEVELDNADITSYMASSDCSLPACYGDLHFLSNTAGKLTYSDIEVRYDPSVIDTATNAQTYLDDNSGDVDIPINVSADYDGNITLSNLNISYYGDKNATITAHFDGTVNYSSSNDSQVVKIIWSNFTLELPNLIEYIDFKPLTVSSKNVTPEGQTSSIPIINISSYSSANADYAIRFDTQPDSCITQTVSNTSSKNDGSLLTETLTRYLTLSSLQSGSWWMWRDLSSCTAGGTYADVIYNISACCSSCVSCW